MLRYQTEKTTSMQPETAQSVWCVFPVGFAPKQGTISNLSSSRHATLAKLEDT